MIGRPATLSASGHMSGSGNEPKSSELVVGTDAGTVESDRNNNIDYSGSCGHPRAILLATIKSIKKANFTTQTFAILNASYEINQALLPPVHGRSQPSSIAALEAQEWWRTSNCATVSKSAATRHGCLCKPTICFFCRRRGKTPNSIIFSNDLQ